MNTRTIILLLAILIVIALLCIHEDKEAVRHKEQMTSDSLTRELIINTNR
jgi:hypothetical protein